MVKAYFSCEIQQFLTTSIFNFFIHVYILSVNSETRRDAPTKIQNCPLLLAQMSKYYGIRCLFVILRRLFNRPLKVQNVFKKLEAV